MASQINNYQCPACTGPLQFAGDSGQVECEYCGSKYTVSEIEEIYAELEKKAQSAFEESEKEAQEQEPWEFEHEDSDWNEEGMKVYNIHFKLIAPNSFDAEDSASKLVKAAQDDVGANIINLDLCNSEGNLKPNKKGIDSYIKYISNGAGDWKLTYLNQNGKREHVSSKQKSTKVNIPVPYDELKNNKLSAEQILLIIECFKKIERVKKFKEN